MKRFPTKLTGHSVKLTLIIFLLLFLINQSPANVSAQQNLFKDACSTGEPSQSPVCRQVAQQKNDNDNPVTGPRGIIQQAANVFALVTVVAGLILIVYSAFVFVTAGGTRAGDNSSRARQARSTLTSAVVGIIVVSFAWLIVTFVNTRIIHS